MNKKELVSCIAQSCDELTNVQAAEALDAFLKAISDSLKKKESVSLVGFGTFSASERKERMGKNPRTGEEMKIPAKNVVKFKAGKVLDEQLNK